MFTGLVESKGRIERIDEEDKGRRLKIATSIDLSDVAIGDSIAVDGVCLTVVALGPDWFDAQVSHETLRVTTLGQAEVSDGVHLEQALRAGARLGGHLVQGHVDCTGRLKSKKANGDCWDLEYALPSDMSIYVVEKGSITVDGVSLTVNGCGSGWFSVTIVPHTVEMTHLLEKDVEQPVNLETDIVGKYVVHAAQHWVPGAEGGLSLDDLKKRGLK